MSLGIKISAKETNNSILVYECTGLFNHDNKTGYGIPNLKVEEAEQAFLEITVPNAKEPILINVFPSFPTSKTDVGFEVFPHMLNMKEIESGEYNIKYTVVLKDKNGASKILKAHYFLFATQSLACCIDKLVKTLTFNINPSPREQEIKELSDLFDAMTYQINCGILSKARELAEYLKSNCKCCGCS